MKCRSSRYSRKATEEMNSLPKACLPTQSPCSPWPSRSAHSPVAPHPRRDHVALADDVHLTHVQKTGSCCCCYLPNSSSLPGAAKAPRGSQTQSRALQGAQGSQCLLCPSRSMSGLTAPPRTTSQPCFSGTLMLVWASFHNSPREEPGQTAFPFGR